MGEQIKERAEHGKEVQTLLTSAAQLLKESHLQQAEALYKQALVLAPECAEAAYALGTLYADRGQQAAATAFLTRAAKLAPSFSGAQPFVSAIVSAYKCERFLRGCLEDLERQTIADRLEIIVVDSGSPENEGAIVKECQQRYNNIVYIRTEEREGIYAAWNRGIRAARGKYITNANSDDRHRADAFERMVSVLEAKPDVALVYANVYITERENETFEKHTASGAYRWLDFDPLRLVYGCYIGPQPMWRRSVHDRYGYFDESFESAGDWEFWLRIAETEKFFHIDEFLGLYLKSPTSAEHRDRSLSAREAQAVHLRYRHRVTSGQIGTTTSREGVQGRETTLMAPETVVLVRAIPGQEDQLRSCLAQVRRFLPPSLNAGVTVVGSSQEIAAAYDASQIDGEPALALAQALGSATKAVVLLSQDVLVTEGWLERLIAIATADAKIAAVGPVANQAPRPQRVKGEYKSLKRELQKFAGQRARRYGRAFEEAPYLGSFCLLLRGDAARQVGGLEEKLPLVEALWQLFARLREKGFTLACAKGIYVHHERLTEDEGAQFDERAAAEAALPSLLAEVEDAQAQGDWPRAIELIERAMALSAICGRGDNTALLNRLGYCQFMAGSLTEAESSFLRGLQADPARLDLLNNLAELYLSQGELAQATEYVKRALAVNPNDVGVLLSLGNCSAQLGEFQTALMAFKRVRELAPETEGIDELVEQCAQLAEGGPGWDEDKLTMMPEMPTTVLGG